MKKKAMTATDVYAKTVLDLSKRVDIMERQIGRLVLNEKLTELNKLFNEQWLNLVRREMYGWFSCIDVKKKWKTIVTTYKDNPEEVLDAWLEWYIANK